MSGLDIIHILFLGALIAFAFSIEYYMRKLKISPLPTHKSVWKIIKGRLPDSPDGDIYELGSGWGGLLIRLGRYYPEHNVVGFEKSFLPYWFTWLRLKIFRYENIELKRNNFLKKDLSDASLVLCYLSDWHMDKLEPKFENELDDGATVISNSFALPHTLPDETAETDLMLQDKIFIYKDALES